jgi:8-amino-7-oxononanoate synthase
MSEHEPIDAHENFADFDLSRISSDGAALPARSSGGSALGGFSSVATSIAKKLDSAARVVRVASPPTHYKTRSFKDHALYHSMQKYRLLADTVGLADPFFKEHQARLGATTIIDGKCHISFGSYDYLGLNQAKEVGEAAKAAIDQYGTSVSASRVVAGERPLHRELERELAAFYETEDALTFVSGHATNVSTISTLIGPGDLVLYDDLMHNSAIVGAKLSGATAKSFPHNNLEALQRLLVELRGQHENVMIVVEGLYSMDGDIPDLPRLIELKSRFGAWLMVDEAHSLGVLGATGRGIAEHYGVSPKGVDIWMGTLSKTLGSCGGYICGSKELIMILKFKAPGFVYSVGMPAPAAAAAMTALRLLKSQPERIARLKANGHLFLDEARMAGLNTATSIGYAVVPVIIGDGVKAVKMTERLFARGIDALPIVYPAVPMKLARLRFFITSEHTAEQIKTAVRVTKEELKIVTSLGGVFRRTPKLQSA